MTKTAPLTLAETLADVRTRQFAAKSDHIAALRDAVEQLAQGQPLGDERASELADALDALDVKSESVQRLVDVKRRHASLVHEVAGTDKKLAELSREEKAAIIKRDAMEVELAAIRRRISGIEGEMQSVAWARQELSRVEASNPLLFASTGDALAEIARQNAPPALGTPANVLMFQGAAK